MRSNLFGIALLGDFLASNMDTVPAPKVTPKDLETQIVALFYCDRQLIPLAKIEERFSHIPKTEVKTTLDSLCAKGILYGLRIL